MSNVVATGRRINGRDGLIAEDLPTGIHAAAQTNAVAGGLRDGDGTDLHGVIAAHRIDVSSLRPTLNGGSRDDRQIVFRIDEKVHVHKLIGEESVVRIVKDGLQLVGAGGGIDLIVDGKKLAGGDFLGVVAIEGVDVELNTSAELGIDLGKVVLGQAEEHSDGLELGDKNEAIRVGGVNDISRIDKAKTYAAADGSGNSAIGELQFGVVHLA